ncbi:MAG: hypothetical protein J0I10_00050, partial [Verrucomicrobia bacterium]|nr:hypothetical protein [Verrucomicrobiota bacterium]
LLSEEFRAVLDDHMLSEQRTASISASALSNDNITQIDKDIADSLPNGNIPTRAARNAAKKIREGDTISEHQKFAALFCSRTQYTKTLRVLTFGTIVRFKNPNDDNWQFAICLIPSCDSLRLDPEQPAHFPFWTLQKDDYPESGGGKRSGMILLSRAGEPIALSASPSKAGQRIWTTSLSVSQQNRRVVASSVEDNFVFQCFDGRSIEWVGQLKTLHAHRIANTIMHDLCRVGLSEAEWLRLTCSST